MTIPVNLPDQPEIEDMDALVAHWSEDVTITMSRSEWQFIQINLQLRGSDRRMSERKSSNLLKMARRIAKLID